MLRKTLNLLLEPASKEGEGGGGDGGQKTFTPASVTSVQVDALKSSQGTPVQKGDAPLPESLKGVKFDISGEPDLKYDDNPDAKKVEFEDPKKGNIPPAKEKEEGKLEAPEIKLEKKEEKVETPTKPPPAKVDAPVKPDEFPKGERDYSVFPEELRDVLKNTGNPAFKFITETYVKAKALEKEVETLKTVAKDIEEKGFPSQWTTHSEAWRLHPEANRLMSRVQKIEFEENHWMEQLQRINAGHKYTEILGYQKDGTPVFSSEIEPSSEAKDKALLTLGKYGSIKAGAYNQVNAFAQGFKNHIKTQAETIEKIMDQQFPWRNDPKDENQAAKQELLQVIPEERQGDYMTELAANLYASYMRALKLLEEKKEIESEQTVIKETKRSVEPSVSSPSVSTAIVKPGIPNGYMPPKTFSLDGMV